MKTLLLKNKSENLASLQLLICYFPTIPLVAKYFNLEVEISP